MTLGSFARSSLAEIAVADLDRMLTLDETLFVEHKRDLGRGNENYQLAKAVAAFANTLGGWLLIGVANARPTGEAKVMEAAPTLVDGIRDRLRREIDPLPAFEARIIPHPAGNVGVVRVYESSDTPHVLLRSGSVFVREVAGDTDASRPPRIGGSEASQRVYAANQIRSQAQLMALAARGRDASTRVDELLSLTRPLPLVETGLGFAFSVAQDGKMTVGTARAAAIVVRVAPYTLPPRFLGWSTSADASGACLSSVESLAGLRGLGSGWVSPDPAGVFVAVPLGQHTRHADGVGERLDSTAQVVVDGAGVAGASLQLDAPRDARRARRFTTREAANDLVAPVIRSAVALLERAECLGRARCHVDLFYLPSALRLIGEGESSARDWVSISADIDIPSDETEVQAVAVRAMNAYARSAGIPEWDSAA
ncbi:ATP-binding protein [Solirubrobacter sp. CPCC 204708]|uniref:ATP-binding protein n=1 Tax=Solirubrobacter deserti TaxID=2282478 RepID=A0ABT4RLN1_9ACTN|nr:ATP-binding protein [Solirubrobacter deserti]MBE2320386.1 ATP-binding protein [Solirubrobacter deserti]MDA0139419.1 ATP-binding protein [Solirubrobacter deserti]